MEQVCPKCKSKDISFNTVLEEKRGAGEGFAGCSALCTNAVQQ